MHGQARTSALDGCRDTPPAGGHLQEMAVYAETAIKFFQLMSRQILEQQELGSTSYAVLDHLDNDGPTRPAALAAVVSVSHPTITQLLQRLERRGLVKRVALPDGTGAMAVDLTHDAHEALSRHRHEVHRRLAELFATLAPAEESDLRAAAELALPTIRRLSGPAIRPPRRVMSTSPDSAVAP